jgi:tetratricopeptide (TPR) repeat protein
LGLLRTEPEGAASLLEAAGAALLAYQSFPEDAGFGMALKLYGEELRLAGDTERANHHLNRALAFFRETGDRRRCALTLMALGVERRMRQENAAARTLYEEALLLARESNATAGLAKTQLLLAEIHMEEGDVTRAIASGRSAYETFAALNHRRFVAWAGCNLAGYLIHAGDLAGARTILLEALDALRDEPHPLFLVAIIEHSASVAALEGNHRKAARLLGFVERAVERWRIDREPLEQREHERLVIELSRLEQTELETLLGDGARLSEDSAFDETRALLCAR